MKLDYVSIGRKIRDLRKARGLSQEKLAEKIDVSIPHMSNIENGKTQFSFQKFWELVNALDTTPDKLLLNPGEEEEKERVLILEEINQVLADCDVAQMVVLKENLRVTKEILSAYEKAIKGNNTD